MSTIMAQTPLRISRSVFCGIATITTKPRDLYSTALHKDEKTPTTVNIADVKHHSKIREQWWDINGPMKALHAFNLLRVPLVRDGLVQVPPERKSCTPLLGKKILDVGCGGGILSMPLAKLGADVTGLDAGKELIEMATKEHGESSPPPTGNKPTYVCTTIEEHATNHASHYDGLVASEIIEHIDNNNKELFVKSCLHTLKPGGRIFFTTPTRTKISQFTNICMAEYVLKAVPAGTHQYEKFTTPTELTFLLERNGCHVESVFGIFYNPVLNKWEWINSTNLFFAIQAVKLEEE